MPPGNLPKLVLAAALHAEEPGRPPRGRGPSGGPRSATSYSFVPPPGAALPRRAEAGWIVAAADGALPRP